MKVLLNVSSLPQRSLVLIFALFFLASTSKVQQSVRPDGPDVRLRIETDQPAYRIGDSIRVRLTLRNLSGDPVRFENANYVELATLKVFQAGWEIQLRWRLTNEGHAKCHEITASSVRLDRHVVPRCL